MTTTADIVVAGAGHNSLITAAYLAKAGYECLILDAGEIAGGATATQELLVPGFAFPPPQSVPDDIRSLLASHSIPYTHEYFDAMIAKLVAYLRDEEPTGFPA